MKVAVFGMGYVGLTAIACLLKDGNKVIGIDVSENKVNQVKSGKSPIFEPGVEEEIVRGRDSGALEVSNNSEGVLQECDVAFVCVGTPSDLNGAHNMTFLANVTEQIANGIGNRIKPLYVVYRSTVKPGTIDELILPIFESIHPGKEGVLYDLIYNPEFLRESTAIFDYYNPPKVVFGAKSHVDLTAIKKLYENVDAPCFTVGLKEAELTKFVDNSFHAVKVAFANEIGRLCVANGISAQTVSEIFISDTKLNISSYYLRPGGAFGGSCLPKDVRALSHLGRQSGVGLKLIDSLMDSNESHKDFIANHVTAGLSPQAKILLLGLSFKKNTDDLRESPNVDLAEYLIGKGYSVDVYEPALDGVKLHGSNLAYSMEHLPHLAELLIDARKLSEKSYDIVIDTKGMALELNITTSRIVDINSL